MPKKILSDVSFQGRNSIEISQTELQHLDGVTSPIQTQLNSKVNTSSIGVSNGIAPLDSNGIVPTIHLPAGSGGTGDTINNFYSFGSPNELWENFLPTNGTGAFLNWEGITTNGTTYPDNSYGTIGGRTLQLPNSGTVNDYYTLRLANNIINVQDVNKLTLSLWFLLGSQSTDSRYRFGLSDQANGDGSTSSCQVVCKDGGVWSLITKVGGVKVENVMGFTSSINTLHKLTIVIDNQLSTISVALDAQTYQETRALSGNCGVIISCQRAAVSVPVIRFYLKKFYMNVEDGTEQSISSMLPQYQFNVGFGGNTTIIGVEPPAELTIPIPISQGGTGATTSVNALGALGAQPIHPKLTALGVTTGSGIICHSALTNGFFTRNLEVSSPLTITNPSGLNANPSIGINMGAGSGLDADLLNGVQGSSYLRSDTSDTFTGNLTLNGNLVFTSGSIKTLDTAYGSLRVDGTTGGYSGIYFGSNGYTFMVKDTDGLAGIHKEGVGWNYYIESNTISKLFLIKSPDTTAGSLYLNYGNTNRFQFRGDGNAWSSAYGWTPNWSDENLKRDIVPLTNCLDIVNQLNPVSYRWNTTAMLSEVIGNIEDNSTHYGLIAQQIEPLIKDIVKQGPDAVDGSETYLTYEKTEIIPFLIGAIKELYLLVMAK